MADALISDGKVHRKWRGWVDVIDPHVTNLYLDRVIWREVRDAMGADPWAESDTFLASYTRQYVGAAVMAVRRLGNPSRYGDAHSIGSLIVDIVEHPLVITRDRWSGTSSDPRPRAAEGMKKILSENFDRLFGDGSGLLDVSKLRDDLAALKAGTEKVGSFASRMVAHIDRRGMADLPTFEDLDAAIDVIGEMYKRCYLLVTGGTLIDIAPVVQHDWQAPLRRPIFEPIKQR